VEKPITENELILADRLTFEKEPKYYDQAVLRLNGIDQKGQTSIFTDFDKIEALTDKREQARKENSR